MANEDPAPITILRPDECWALLRVTDVGRLAVVVDGDPDVFPVNFVVDHGSVVFRTAAGAKLAAVDAGRTVAFEADGYEPHLAEAWSVVLKGRAERVSGGARLVETAELPLFPWNAMEKPYFVRIVPAEVTGRRFVVTDREAWRTRLGEVHRSATE